MDYGIVCGEAHQRAANKQEVMQQRQPREGLPFLVCWRNAALFGEPAGQLDSVLIRQIREASRVH